MERRNFARSRLEGQIAYVAALAIRREDRRQWEIWSVRFSAHALLVSILHAPPQHISTALSQISKAVLYSCRAQ
jgi:hypothetical protein